MSWGKTKDFGAYMTPEYCGPSVAVTAAGSGDATEVNGAWIDTQGHESLEWIAYYTATLGDGETLSFAMNVQDADDAAGTGAADVSTDYLSALAATVAATGDSAGSTETGAFAVGVDLTMCKRYVRVQWTPDMSAGGTDTAAIIPGYVLGGSKYPAARASRKTIRA